MLKFGLIIFYPKVGTFEFIEQEYPYVFDKSSIEEMIWDLCDYDSHEGMYYDNEIENVVFVPCRYLPKEIQEKLLTMIVGVDVQWLKSL